MKTTKGVWTYGCRDTGAPLVPGVRPELAVAETQLPANKRGGRGHANNSRTVRRSFDSVRALSEYVKETPRSDINERKTSSESNSNSHSWDLGAGFDGTIELGRTGWQEQASLVEGIVNEVQTSAAPLVVKAVQLKHSVAGPRLDVGRFIVGNPECAILNKRTAKRVKGQAIRISFNMTTSCGVDAMTMVKRGAALTALVNVLQSGGWPVEVWGIDHNLFTIDRGDGSNRHSITTSLRIKSADEMMSLPDLVFAIAHPGVFRRLMFKVYECEDSSIPYGYGEVPDDIPGDLYTDVTFGRGLHSREEAQADSDPVGWVLKHLDGLNLLKG